MSAQHPLASLLLCAALSSACVDREPLQPVLSESPAYSVRPSGIESRFTVPVAFTLPAGTCGLTTDVTGIGEYRFISRLTQTGTGEYHAGIHATAHGTASGADGSRYVFNYMAQGRYVDFTGLPPLEINAVDSFKLLGRGQTADVKTFFNATFRIHADGSFEVVGFKVLLGDPANCDPI